MYRWLSDEPHHVLLIEWRICEVSRDNYETVNFGLSEIVTILLIATYLLILSSLVTWFLRLFAQVSTASLGIDF